MFRQVRHGLAKTSLRTPLVWMRHRDFTVNDVFVGSYPRCGSTWLRFMLNELLVGESSGFKNVNEALPDVGKHNTGLPVLPGNGRLIKTHEPFRREYRKAIYLVRDVRDVMLSEFAYQKALGFTADDLNSYVMPFLEGKVNPFGSWKNHVQTWLDARDSGRADILLVRFEDLRGNSEEPLAEILSFLGRPAPISKIREAMENNAVDRMREKEKINPQRASARGRFIGSGSVGGWRGKLTDHQINVVQRHYSTVLTRVGYTTAVSHQQVA